MWVLERSFTQVKKEMVWMICPLHYLIQTLWSKLLENFVSHLELICLRAKTIKYWWVLVCRLWFEWLKTQRFSIFLRAKATFCIIFLSLLIRHGSLNEYKIHNLRGSTWTCSWHLPKVLQEDDTLFFHVVPNHQHTEYMNTTQDTDSGCWNLFGLSI